MKLEGKALYNFIRISWKKNPTLTVQSWQVEDYRSVADEKLFLRLKKLGLILDMDKLKLYIERCETPEELADCLDIDKENVERHEQIYLIVFELWRRHFPNKPSLSIFCDGIDHLIELYDLGEEIYEDEVLEQLRNLENVMDINVDGGEDPKKVFKYVCRYFANDLEGFIYDFVTEQIDTGDETSASELIDGLYIYVQDSNWFDFLKMRIMALSDVDEANLMLSRLFETLSESPDFELYVEILGFLIKVGRFKLFAFLYPQILKLAATEEEFQQLLLILKDYMHIVDKEEEAETILRLLKIREKNDLSKKFSFKDKTYSELDDLIQNLESS